MLNKSVNDCSEAVRVQKDFARDLLWHFVDLVQIVRRGTPGWLGVKPAVPAIVLAKSLKYRRSTGVNFGIMNFPITDGEMGNLSRSEAWHDVSQSTRCLTQEIMRV
jgi:hypothetical protein